MFVNELKRTRGFESGLVNIGCSAVNIRNPQVHVPLSLADTCQLCGVSLKDGRTTYTGNRAGLRKSAQPLTFTLGVLMQRVATRRDEIYNYFHGGASCQQFFFAAAQEERYAALRHPT